MLDLTADRLDQAVTIAALPTMVRGYEHRKLDGVRLLDAALQEALAEYTSPASAAR